MISLLEGMICQLVHGTFSYMEIKRKKKSHTKHSYEPCLMFVKTKMRWKKIKALQALHDSPPLCLFLLLRMFWHKK